ncbi:ribonuclease HI [Deinococcus sp. HMF7620]|uniref:Ribonuclease H n=1 Tax=Deinococcus arboris TaxID=2682977 RepID=A0A7C9M7P4_9DEIO|nr:MULTISPECIES: ribonuclease HI [Deinococcus]MBZ9752430.1 ribonuclease HI [Deinococcus betulae]MVN88045.1 ribonuclease HI [Deinococcus arboris]
MTRGRPVRSAAQKAQAAARDRLPIQAGIQPEQPIQGENVDLYSDGACDTQAGHGGWATILNYKGKELVLSGHEAGTTNNRMELRGLLEGLKMLKRPCQVRVVTDSQYLRKAFTDGWILKWQRNGWKTAGGDPVKNQDLWEDLIAQARLHALTFVWVKGHAGHGENERVDELAVQERKKLRKA